MRAFRLLAVALVLLVAGGLLGSACAGAKGKDGAGIQSIANNTDGTLTIYLTNGQSYTTGDLTGPQGAKGDTGAQGEQGIQGPQGLPGAGISWEGEWDSSTVYGINDAVGYLGSSYVSKQDGNANHVPTDTAWWDLWVAKGDTGVTGADGEDGVAGAPGPNMIVAAGNIDSDLTIHQRYNVTSVTWYVDRYEITLTGITYNRDRYVTLVTPVGARRSVFTSSGSGKLYVYIWNNLGEATQDQFHFVVLDTTLG